VRRLGLPSYGKGSRFQSDLWLVVIAWYLETGGQSMMLAKGICPSNSSTAPKILQLALEIYYPRSGEKIWGGCKKCWRQSHEGSFSFFIIMTVGSSS
jgi:hypothetical protein